MDLDGGDLTPAPALTPPATSAPSGGESTSWVTCITGQKTAIHALSPPARHLPVWLHAGLLRALPGMCRLWDWRIQPLP